MGCAVKKVKRNPVPTKPVISFELCKAVVITQPAPPEVVAAEPTDAIDVPLIDVTDKVCLTEEDAKKLATYILELERAAK
jgi:hypothetical protein